MFPRRQKGGAEGRRHIQGLRALLQSDYDQHSRCCYKYRYNLSMEVKDGGGTPLQSQPRTHGGERLVYSGCGVGKVGFLEA